tara:strand:+ start:2487 stop:3413 length:927 start_codon:yes stop_codon:yes gene_type:complete
MKIAAIIPCYKIKNDIIDLINKSLNYFDEIIVVDDKCPYQTGFKVQNRFENKKKVKVLFNDKNLGVGGAIKNGIHYLLNKNIDIFVKIDGDGQMSLNDLDFLLKPIINNQALYVKGSRFLNYNSKKIMPIQRYYGNKLMSLFFRFFSNDLSLTDPLNGYLVMSNKIFDLINYKKLSNDFFFETDLLFFLKEKKIKVIEIPVTINYEDHNSSFKPILESYNFTSKFIKKSIKRLIFTHLNLKKLSIMFIPTSLLVFTFFYSLIDLLKLISYLILEKKIDIISLIKIFFNMATYFIIYRIFDIIYANVKR